LVTTDRGDEPVVSASIKSIDGEGPETKKRANFEGRKDRIWEDAGHLGLTRIPELQTTGVLKHTSEMGNLWKADRKRAGPMQKEESGQQVTKKEAAAQAYTDENDGQASCIH